MSSPAKAVAKVAETATEAVSEAIELPGGDILLMGLGVLFAACLVAHFVFGVGVDPIGNLKNETASGRIN